MIVTCPTCGHRQNKSDIQRNLFHALCREIGKEIGLEPGKVKEAVKADFYGIDEFKVGNKWYRGIRSSEDSDRIEYSELIDFAYRWAADAGIYIGDKK